ncbi:hypothetical protein VZQ01_04555 [Myxococcus faecalis]|uniref:hypothetical protein n=1 Tax=Myxococcus TaxID=32 RepID=UPI001CBBFB7C|nr:hypothetical protein [Myxococcus sp. AS-1-15]MBZ4397117.1 hypothetical protein [Myxococcus sp. AS-1-15]BDT33255.1 hypothetical protein MFMH1_29240 [Myxococcus sp. MH1]
MVKLKVPSFSSPKLNKNPADSISPPKKTPTPAPAPQDTKFRNPTNSPGASDPKFRNPTNSPGASDPKFRNPTNSPGQSQRPTDGFEGKNPLGGRGTRAMDALSNISGVAAPAMETLANVSGAALPAMQALSPMMAGGIPGAAQLSPMMAGGLPGAAQLSPMMAGGLPAMDTLAPMQQGLPAMDGFSPMQQGLPAMGGFSPMQQGLPAMDTLAPTQQGLPAMGGFSPMQQGLPAMDTLAPMNAPMQRGMPSLDALPPELGLPMAPPMMTPNMLEGLRVPSLPGPAEFGPRGMPPEAQNLSPTLPHETANPAPRGLPPQLRDMIPARETTPRVTQQAEPESSGIPSANDKRPAGDKRSAAQIVDDSPALKNLGRQKDIKFDLLCKQTGIDPKLDLKDAKQNPDAVFRLAKVLEFIDSAKAANGGDRDNKVKNGKGDGNIEGITKDGDARHGTEAGMVKDFAEKGYSFLGEQKLPETKDTHVKADGSNKDNFQWAAGEAGKHLWFLPGVSNVLTGIGNSEGGVKGVFEGAAKGYVNTLKGAAEGVLGAVTTGRINPASLILGGAAGALANTEAAPQPVKDIASML